MHNITSKTLQTVIFSALVVLVGCGSGQDSPKTEPQGTIAEQAGEGPAAEPPTDAADAEATQSEAARGSGSIGGWRARPGQRTIFNRGFRIPTTITFRADRGNWQGQISIVETPSNRSLCSRTISGGGNASCFGIQGNFRLTVANDASSRDTATGEIRFNN